MEILLAERLSKACAARVHWRLVARSGLTTAGTLHLLQREAPEQADLAVVVSGVNDVVEQVPSHHAVSARDSLANWLRNAHGVQHVAFAPLPPVHHFPGLPQPLRWVAGAKLGTIPVVGRPVDVVNMSFGGPGLSFTLQRAIDEVIAQGLLVVVAAGNGGTEATTYSPGGLDGVITVGASDDKGRRAVYSNYGPRVDLLAPGGGLSEWDYETDLAGRPPEGILSTYRDEGIAEPKRPPFTYSALTGTSQAAPHVAGAAALALWAETLGKVTLPWVSTSKSGASFQRFSRL